MTENKEERNRWPVSWPARLAEEDRLRHQKCCICLPAVLAQIHYFLLSGIHRPFILYQQSAKVTRWVFDVLTAYITKNNKLSGLRQHLNFYFLKKQNEIINILLPRPL